MEKLNLKQKIRRIAQTGGRAFTLIEVIIVLSVMMVLVGLASLSVVSFGKGSDVEGGRAAATQAIREAQSNSFANLGDVSWGVHFDSNKVVLYSFSNGGYNPSDPANHTIILPEEITFNADFGGSANAIFNKGKTTLVNGGILEVVSPNRTIQININSEGMID
jgi:type II secretory pathway pseudopilin PulG